MAVMSAMMISYVDFLLGGIVLRSLDSSVLSVLLVLSVLPVGYFNGKFRIRHALLQHLEYMSSSNICQGSTNDGLPGGLDFSRSERDQVCHAFLERFIFAGEISNTAADRFHLVL